jgi:hypothetical protein
MPQQVKFCIATVTLRRYFRIYLVFNQINYPYGCSLVTSDGTYWGKTWGSNSRFYYQDLPALANALPNDTMNHSVLSIVQKFTKDCPRIYPSAALISRQH